MNRTDTAGPGLATSSRRTTARFTLRSLCVSTLLVLALAALAQTQHPLEKKKLTIRCYWQNWQMKIFMHLQNYPWSYGCEKYQDPTHCLRTANEMLTDTKHDWERVTANG